MSFKIELGLFDLDFTDYHAILGVPVDAEPKDIRKQYLKIARRLHPDSFITGDGTDRQQASELLSKLVNPAYEKLSQEKNYAEYILLLRLKGQQALRQQETVQLTGEPARKLAAVGDVNQSYKAALRELAEKQYQQLSQVLELTGQISELNLIYLMRKEGKGESIGTQPKKQEASATSGSGVPLGGTRSPFVNRSPVKPPPTREELAKACVLRAHEFESKQDYPKAILELREATQIEPRNSGHHSRLGLIYLKLNQSTMARIHFNQALKLNPQDSVALEGKRRIEQSADPKAAAQKSASRGSKPDPRNKPDNSGGGLFGLFGGKKK